MIRNLTPRPAEKGRIKIGGLGDERKKKDGSGTYMLPIKFDHFEIVTMQRDAAGRFIQDKDLMDRLMQAQGVQKLLEIPIRLLFDDVDLNFFTRYSAYSGTRCVCSGDGVEAQRLGQDDKYNSAPCPCERLEADFKGQPKCKPLGNLRCLIEGVDRVGGIWSFRTTSWNTVNAILSSLALIRTITGGPLAGIPLMLVLSPKTVTTPDGKSMVVFIVSIEYRGPEQHLAELGYEIARKRIERRVKMETIEVEARRLLVAPHEEPAPDQADTAAEFYPDSEIEKPDSPEPQGKAGKTTPAPATSLRPEPSSQAGTQAQDPGNGGGQEALQQAITLPDLMGLVKHPDAEVNLPLSLVTTKGIQIGQWLDWAPNLGGEMQVILELVENLKEVAQGLTVEMIEKSFNEAGIVLKITTAAEIQEGKDRLADSTPTTHGGPSTAALPRGHKGTGDRQGKKSLF